MQKIGLIVAGGKGIRMNSNIPKQFLILNNLPVLMHTLKAFAFLNKIILVLPENQFNYWEDLCKKYNFNQKYHLVAGGKNRFSSVKNGLSQIRKECLVAIHDGVRPIISKEHIINLLSNVDKGTGVIPIIKMENSVRKIAGGKSIALDRANIYHVQTPQCFLSSDIKKSYNQPFSKLFTDDATVFENDGGEIRTILGEPNNIKITTKKDLKTIDFLL